MTEHYNKAISQHYAAYRPPLHQVILERMLPAGSTFSMGLDIGCGTGYSSKALMAYCEKVLGIDPSQDMLNRASPHPGIEYRLGSGEDISVPDHSVDIATFAGSLFYAKSEKLVQELVRVTKPGGLIAAYDFEILTAPVLSQFNLPPHHHVSSYDHEVNFSDCESLNEVKVHKETLGLEVSAQEMAHVILSSHDNYRTFSERYEGDEPFVPLVREIEQLMDNITLQARLYYSLYRV